MMSGTGEYIELRWDDYPQFYVIRGHVPFAEAMNTLVASVGAIEIAGQPVHGYCRWQFNGQDEWGNRRRELWESGPGRGAFKCTVFRTKWHHEVMNAAARAGEASNVLV